MDIYSPNDELLSDELTHLRDAEAKATLAFIQVLKDEIGPSLWAHYSHYILYMYLDPPAAREKNNHQMTVRCIPPALNYFDATFKVGCKLGPGDFPWTWKSAEFESAAEAARCLRECAVNKVQAEQ